MTTQSFLMFSALIITLTMGSCNNSDNTNNNIPVTATDETIITQKAEPTSTANIGGTYSFGNDVEKGAVGSIIIYPVTEYSALFFLDVCRGAPSYNTGQLFGNLSIQGNIGTYDSKKYSEDINCLLKFEFNSDIIKVSLDKEHNDCGFGHAVNAENSYTRLEDTIPEFFVEGQGDTIYFEGLTVEKYNHRFD